MHVKPAAQRAATRLSGIARRSGAIDGHFTALARLSLGVLSVSMLSGCLIEDPPSLREAKQTPPRLDSQAARPLVDQLISARNNETIRFTVPVTSEDAGEGLTAVLVLDYLDGAAIVPDVIAPYSNLAPSTLDDKTERAFKLDWTVSKVSPGCHRVTLLAGHASTFFDLSNLVNRQDLDVEHWWAIVDATPENESQLQDCPDASRPPLGPAQ